VLSFCRLDNDTKNILILITFYSRVEDFVFGLYLKSLIQVEGKLSISYSLIDIISLLFKKK
jgi:hypothetical protein